VFQDWFGQVVSMAWGFSAISHMYRHANHIGQSFAKTKGCGRAWQFGAHDQAVDISVGTNEVRLFLRPSLCTSRRSLKPAIPSNSA
jgi:hypothetical protein